MSYRLPPLNALKVFEAASRLLSAKRAAEELHVTPAAVSHQIKLLETHLGFSLFNRLNRQLFLTEMGQRYSHVLQEVFKKLADETEKLTQNIRSQLALSVEPAFAIYWLISRLKKFKKQHPDIELRISSNYEVVDLKKNNMDIGIRWGNGKYPGLMSTLIFRNEVYPVCSPALWKKHPIKKPNDLKHHTLLHETASMMLADYPDWRTWTKKFNADKVNPESGLYFETGYLLIQAAIEGQGVALERAALVESAIKSGKLIKPFNSGIRESANGYYLVFPENRAADAKIQSFSRWLAQEAKKWR
jgi:LysR family glycine cleavage system transcriptional activator